MDWLLCVKFVAFFVLMVSLECNCEWHAQANHGKDENGKIIWETLQLKRQKREWIVPPVVMREGEDNRHRNPLAKVRSDIEIKQRITYTVSGPGVNLPPLGVFVINPHTGDLNVTNAIIDREQIPIFYLVVRAITAGGQDIEKPLELRVRVMDINDNPPIFSQSIFVGSVAERSSANTMVMQITATDADEENTLNSKIAYKIISQDPGDPVMFIMNQFTGQVFTMSGSLDREQHSGYSLVIGGSDLNGAAGGLGSQCGANIQILDVNDNFPMLEYDSYSAQIMENSLNDRLLIMKVFDADEMYSDNWVAVIDIVSGNEGGWFMTETNVQTNEVYLKVIKQLDYEAMQMMNLGIVVSNRAAFHYSVISEYKAQMSSISISVKNENEGPAFFPSTQTVTIPSGMTREQIMQYILTKFEAINQDTGKVATNVVYLKGKDVENWLFVDSTTGEVKLINMMNPDSPNVVNGTYYAEILAVDNDLPDRTATATIAVAVPGGPSVGTTARPGPDNRGNCPTLTLETRPMCAADKMTYITAYGTDNTPYRFEIVAPNVLGWTLTSFNATTAVLRGANNLADGNYTVDIHVRDNANESCPNPWKVPIQVCECTVGKTCDATKTAAKSVSLGPAAIGLMVLGLIALLLAPLLMLLCLCGSGAASGFVPVAGGYDGACRPWGTEGAHPEDVDVTNMLISSGPEYSEYHNNYAVGVGQGGMYGAGIGAGIGTAIGTAAGTAAVVGGLRDASGTGFGGTTTMGEGGMGFSGESNMAASLAGVMPPYKEGSAVNMGFVENYFTEKADSYANEDESRPANDCLLIYDNEGVGSPSGSIGCCSFIADDLDDSYLDTLGSKFKTLAEICIGKEIEPEYVGNDDPRVTTNISLVETDTNVRLEESHLNFNAPPPVPVGTSTYVTESTYSSSNLQPARPIPDTYIPGNVVVTETYTTSGSSLKPTTLTVEPRHQPNILVTERVVGSPSGLQGGFPDMYDGSNVIVTERMLGPSSGIQGGFQDYDGSNVIVTERIVGPNSGIQGGFSEMYDGSNVIVTERVLRPASGMIDFPNITDGSNVVLRERSMAPSSGRQSNTFNIPDLGDGQNVVVTERVIQPVSNVQANRSRHQDLAGGKNVIVTEKTVVSGSGMKSHMLSADPMLQQSIGSTSPSLSRSKVTKYSTVQYTKK